MQPLALFRRLFVVSRWFQRRLTPAGALVVATGVAAGAFGVDTRASLAHVVFCAAVSLLAVSLVSRARLRPDIEPERHLPRFVTVGMPIQYVIVIRNRSDRPLRGLMLEKCLRQPYPSAAEFSRRRTRASNWIDRAVGYPDWIESLRRLRRLEIAPAPIPDLHPGQTAEVSLELHPLHRGVVSFESIGLSRPDPLGLWRSCIDVPTPAALVVLPRTYPVRWPDLGGARRHHPGGIPQASRVGDSEEFRSLRDYRPGDPMRAIHWRSFAKTGRPVVKEQQQEYFARHALVLDTAAADGDETFETSVSLAASFAIADRGADSLLDLLFVGADAHCITIGRGLGSADTLLRVLAGVQPASSESFAKLAGSVASHAAAVSSAILVLQTWDVRRERLVALLKGLGVAVRAYVVTSDVTASTPPTLPPEARWITPGNVREALVSL